MGKVIGIDLGSTNSCVSVMEGNIPTVIVNNEGSRTTPSIIGLKNGERKVGEMAKRQRVVNPKETVSIIKRFMGCTYEECLEACKHVSYDIVNKGGYPKMMIEGREYSPEELSSFILTKMKQIAEDYLGETITDAVITVPAYFSDAARNATKMAGELAGLNVLRIIAEPTAALLASNLDVKNDERKVMVVDFGGATLDFSVAEISDGMIEIKSSKGDMFCGGSDIDTLISDWLISSFKEETGVNLKDDAQALQRVVEAAEKAKIELSSSSTTEINLPYISVNENTPVHLVKTLTKAKFEQIIQPVIDKIIKCGKEALEASGFKSSELNGILLVGGSCRIPILQEELKRIFQVEIYKTANLDECVSLGATVQGSIIKGDSTDMLLVDVTPLSLGIETMGGIMTKLVEANTTIPIKKTEIFTTAEDNQPTVSIKVLQGERSMAKDNKTIGLFNLDNILPARRGTPKIEVSFDIDVNGILTVAAKDVGTGKEQKITIESKSGLSQEEIDRIKKEAEEFAIQDKKEKEEIEKLNKADSLSFQTEKQMEEFKDKISDDEKNKLTEILSELKDVVKNKVVDKVDFLEKKLTDTWTSISSKLYSNIDSNPFANMGGDNPFSNFNFNSQTPSEDKNSSTSTNEVQDTEFEEVK